MTLKQNQFCEFITRRWLEGLDSFAIAWKATIEITIDDHCYKMLFGIGQLVEKVCEMVVDSYDSTTLQKVIVSGHVEVCLASN